jgi:Tfp pilus assembly protein PilF
LSDSFFWATFTALNENEAARQRFDQALKIYRDIGNRLGEANCLQGLGHVHQALNENEAARQRFDQALKIYRDIGIVTN